VIDRRRPLLSRLGELLPQPAAQLRVDLADPALRDAQAGADLPQRPFLPVEQHGHLPLPLREGAKRPPKPLAQVLPLHAGKRIDRGVFALDGLDPLDLAVLLLAADRLVERGDFRTCKLVEAAGELGDGDPQLRRQLLLAGRSLLAGDKPLAGGVDLALACPQAPRRPVVAAQLVEDRPLDPRPGELLERRPLCRVVAVDRGDQRLHAAGEKVVDLALGGDLPDLPVDEVADHRREHEDQPVPLAAIPGLLVFPPDPQRLGCCGPAPWPLHDLHAFLQASRERPVDRVCQPGHRDWDFCSARGLPGRFPPSVRGGDPLSCRECH